MRRVGEILKDCKEYLIYLQPAGKARLLILLAEVFLLLIIVGLLLGQVTIWYFFAAILGSTCYVLFIVIRTLNRFK